MDYIFKITVYTMQNKDNEILVIKKPIKQVISKKPKPEKKKILSKTYEQLFIENKFLILKNKFFKSQFNECQEKLIKSEKKFKLATKKTIDQDKEDYIERNQLLEEIIVENEEQKNIPSFNFIKINKNINNNIQINFNKSVSVPQKFGLMQNYNQNSDSIPAQFSNTSYHTCCGEEIPQQLSNISKQLSNISLENSQN